MEEIKVDEYVRIKGYIGTVENINDFRESSMKYAIEIPKANDLVFVGEQDIENHSFNIIDLIEVGDYVNGKLVKMNYESGKLRIPKNIKSIVTKEAFASVEYKI